MRYPLFLIFLFVLGFNLISQPNPYPVQKQWKLVRLEQAYLNCGDYFPVLTDEFAGNGLNTDLWATTLYASTGNNLYDRLHTNESECIYLDQNVSVSNGVARLTAKNEVASWQGVTRDVTCGTIWSKKKFNLGKYEIRCKLPPTKFWAAFWMWHGDEIDIVDVATDKYSTFASITRGENSTRAKWWIQETIKDPGDGWNVFSFEWTPFRMTFYFNGTEQLEIYRYHTLDGDPLVVECGMTVPAGVYRLNPAFVDFKGKWFAPTAWINVPIKCWDIEANCDDDNDPTTTACDGDNDPVTHCGPNVNPKHFPGEFLIDYIKVEERVYDEIKLESACTQLCEPQEICFTLVTETLNNDVALFPEEELKAYAIESVQVVSPGNTSVAELNDERACLDYEPSSSMPNSLAFTVTLDDGQNSFAFSYEIDGSAPPIIYEFDYIESNEYYLCIDPNSSCGQYSFTPPYTDALQLTDLNNNLDCYQIEPFVPYPCDAMSVMHDECETAEEAVLGPRYYFSGYIDGNSTQPIADFNIVTNSNTYIELYTLVDFPVEEWSWKKISGPGQVYPLSGSSVSSNAHTPFAYWLTAIFNLPSKEPLVLEVTARYKNGCSHTRTIRLLYSNFFKLYPNPTANDVTVSLNEEVLPFSETRKSMGITRIDIRGVNRIEVIHSKEYLSVQEASISLERYPPGVYTLIIYSDFGVTSLEAVKF